jgi:putative transposase
MKKNQVARLLACVTGMVNQQLLLQNEYLVAENRILRAHLPPRLLLTDPERSTLAALGKRLGRKGLEPVATAAKPDTILAWFRKLVAQKFDGSRRRLYPGRPPIGREITKLIVRMARENNDWGYDRIAGALQNLGHDVSDQTVGNILRRFVLVLLPSVGSR